MDYVELTEQVRKFTQESVKKTRYEHCVRVAQMCTRICRLYNLDEQKGYLAGIGHDMCKEFSNEKMIELAQKDGNVISEFEFKEPSLLHGRAAAVLLKEKFQILDDQILEAVANHIHGKMFMCDLTKVLYIADKVEEGRAWVTKEYLEELFSLTLNQMYYKVLKEGTDYLNNNKEDFMPLPEVVSLLEYYKDK